MHFGKLNESSHMNTAGTGLGLSICKMIIEKIGGQVEVTSKRGVGSTFTINIKAKCKCDIDLEQEDCLNESRSVSFSSQDDANNTPFVFLETNDNFDIECKLLGLKVDENLGLGDFEIDRYISESQDQFKSAMNVIQLLEQRT